MNSFKNRKFKVWSFTVSHSFLIIRSQMLSMDMEGYSSETDYNIDIEFSAVRYLNIPADFEGIEIYEVNKVDIPEKFNSYFELSGFKLFELKSKDHTYQVIAGNCVIGKNRWDTENRVSNHDLKHDSIIASYI